MAELKNGVVMLLRLLCLLLGAGKALLFTIDTARYLIEIVILFALRPWGILSLEQQ
jgi:hypothetical protein